MVQYKKTELQNFVAEAFSFSLLFFYFPNLKNFLLLSKFFGVLVGPEMAEIVEPFGLLSAFLSNN
jgi:hypothetical protein